MPRLTARSISFTSAASALRCAIRVRSICTSTWAAGIWKPHFFKEWGGWGSNPRPPDMRSTAQCNTRASCTDDTGHRTDDVNRCTGIIWRAGPRTGPRPRRPCPLVLLLCVTSLRAPSLRPREQARRYRADSSTVRSCLPLHMPSDQRKHHRARFAAATLSAIRVRTNFAAFSGPGRRVRVCDAELRVSMSAGAPRADPSCRISQKAAVIQPMSREVVRPGRVRGTPSSLSLGHRAVRGR